jgi:integrase
MALSREQQKKIKKVSPTEGPVACRPKSGERWCVKDRHADGSPVHRHVDTEREAKEMVRSLGAEHVGGRRVPGRPSQETFQNYAERWRASQVHADRASVRYALQRAYGRIGTWRLADLDEMVINALQRQLLEEPRPARGQRGQANSILAPYDRGTVELTMVYVRAVLRQAVRRGLCDMDLGELQTPRRDPHDTDGIVTPDMIPTQAEAVAILAATPTASRYTQARPRYRLGVSLGFGCGLRIGEVLGLRPCDVSDGAKTIKVDQQYQRRGYVSPKTWRGVRTIEVPDQVRIELLRALQDQPAPTEPFLIGPRGGTMTRDSFSTLAWKPALIGAGLPAHRYTFHATRHYAVSVMTERRVSVAEIAEYIGDAVETVQRTYVHVLRDAPKTARAALTMGLGPVPADVAEDQASDAPDH